MTRSRYQALDRDEHVVTLVDQKLFPLLRNAASATAIMRSAEIALDTWLRLPGSCHSSEDAIRALKSGLRSLVDEVNAEDDDSSECEWDFRLGLVPLFLVPEDEESGTKPVQIGYYALMHIERGDEYSDVRIAIEITNRCVRRVIESVTVRVRPTDEADENLLRARRRIPEAE